MFVCLLVCLFVCFVFFICLYFVVCLVVGYCRCPMCVCPFVNLYTGPTSDKEAYLLLLYYILYVYLCEIPLCIFVAGWSGKYFHHSPDLGIGI